MASIAVIGFGFAGYTATLYLGDKLGNNHVGTMSSVRAPSVRNFFQNYYIQEQINVEIVLSKLKYDRGQSYQIRNVNYSS